MTDTASELDPSTGWAGPTAEAPPEAALMQLLMGGFVTQSIGVAARFGVADALAQGPRHVDDIAAEVGAHAPSLYRLLRALGDFGVFAELTGRRFALTPAGELLRSDSTPSLRGLAEHFGSGFHRAAWSGLYDSVRTGEAAFERVHGAPQFDYYRSHPEEAAIFDAAMTSVASAIYATLESYDFGRFSTVVDVGGGNGAYLSGILASYPALRGVLFDLPDVVERSAPVLAKAGVADRCEVAGGSFFDAVPQGADAYVLTAVIHDWDDEASVRILRNCRAAMPAHATLLLGEPVLPDGPEPSVGKLLDLETLIGTTGRQRTEAEFRELLDRAGLRLTRVLHSPGPDSLVEAVPR
ncbi:acetylserotonin O-methyltransferase [Streptomyces hygroscopicus]|uniref:acetylserotonin O-methyltransferase n=1 Tax=Streptomyces hygroscopicus TaxID=1912 RepID=UPI001FCC5D0E|nr:acetylserotonin O-methyltransferase [Streptomyces hygroscopicus]BDH13339.1 hydroxyneurosporene-O-methyltransferase [Streptomyces hygroscopicus]